MWEPDPVLCCAVDYTVNTEKEEVILVSSSFSYTICIQPYSGCFFMLPAVLFNRKSFHSSLTVLTRQC